jgi:RHS repeat-associated protein
LDKPYFFTGRMTETLHADAFELASDTDFKRLQYNRNRTYGPKHGRWLQRDPLGRRPDPPLATLEVAKQYTDGMNLHEYTSGHPTGVADPLGLVKEKLVDWVVTKQELSEAGRELLHDYIDHIKVGGKKVTKADLIREARAIRKLGGKYVVSAIVGAATIVLADPNVAYAPTGEINSEWLDECICCECKRYDFRDLYWGHVFEETEPYWFFWPFPERKKIWTADFRKQDRWNLNRSVLETRRFDHLMRRRECIQKAWEFDKKLPLEVFGNKLMPPLDNAKPGSTVLQQTWGQAWECGECGMVDLEDRYFYTPE